MICGVVLLLCTSAANLHAQPTGGNGESPCFTIHVRLNGTLVDGPATVTFKTPKNEEVVSLEGGCFRVPADVLSVNAVDVLFRVVKNKVYLSSILTGFFAGPWDIELEDKRFGRDVILPKHAQVKSICAVNFHVGEPERAMSQAPCRTPL